MCEYCKYDGDIVLEMVTPYVNTSVKVRECGASVRGLKDC